MSLATKYGRISVKPFAKVPPLGELPGILPAPASVSDVSSNHGTEELGRVDLSEGCLVTKTLKYTHQLVHWVNAVGKGDPTEVESIVHGLLIVPYPDFTLDDPCNLAFLEPFVHTSLDLYAFIAVTPSFSTLNGLIKMVRGDNHRRRAELDAHGIDPQRSLKFSIPSFTNPEYELVALHPGHFLPVGSVLPVYDPATRTHKAYVPAQDRFLRESPDPRSGRLPAFYHTSRRKRDHLNVFLVALNAEIKFRRYLKTIQSDPPEVSLPNEVLDLMRLTKDLVDEIYWEAKPGVGTRGEVIIAESEAQRRKDIASRGNPEKRVKCSREDIEDVQKNDKSKTRKAYGRALMDGYDRDYDPELFVDASPLDYTHLYSDVEAWRKEVSSTHGAEKPSDDAVPRVEE